MNTTPEEVIGQTAGSQLVKNTALNRPGQTSKPKQPIIHNDEFQVGNDTLWTTKVKVSHSAGSEGAQTSSCAGNNRCINL
jgi:hypothetical protein